MPPLSGSWANALKGEFSKDYYKKLFQTVGAEYKTHTIYPPAVIFSMRSTLPRLSR